MKIDFIISSLKGGGAERVMALLATNLSKRKGFDITVITLNKGEGYNLDQSISRVTLCHGSISNHTIRSFVNLYKYYKNKNNRPHVIISFITLTNFITIPIAKLFSIKIIAAEHNSHLRIMNGRKFLSDFTRKVLYKKADLVTVLTSFDIPYYKKHGSNVIVMPNPCSFTPIEDIHIQREKVILAVGSLDRYHHKGFDNLIKFIAPVLKDNPDWTLKIAGGGDDGLQYLTRIVKDQNIEHQVCFTGFVSEISKLMESSSVFILPSRFEGLPMVLLEAMSQGMACIAYDCKTGPSDIISNNSNGLLIEDQNEKEMTLKLTQLLNNDTLRLSLGKEAIKSLERFDLDTIINQYISIFESLQDKS
ncbi:glycosyltransferase family 4 protein [Winogradskyella sp. PC D3.3]